MANKTLPRAVPHITARPSADLDVSSCSALGPHGPTRSVRIRVLNPRQPGGIGWPVSPGQAGGDTLGLVAADLGDVVAAFAAGLFSEHGGVLPRQPPGQLLPQVGVAVVAAGPLADDREGLLHPGGAGGEELHDDGDVGVQAGVTVVADRAAPVAVDRGQVLMEVPAPPAPGTVIDEAAR